MRWRSIENLEHAIRRKAKWIYGCRYVDIVKVFDHTINRVLSTVRTSCLKYRPRPLRPHPHLAARHSPLPPPKDTQQPKADKAWTQRRNTNWHSRISCLGIKIVVENHTPVFSIRLKNGCWIQIQSSRHWQGKEKYQRRAWWLSFATESASSGSIHSYW